MSKKHLEQKFNCVDRESNPGPIEIDMATMDFTTKPSTLYDNATNFKFIYYIASDILPI